LSPGKKDLLAYAAEARTIVQAIQIENTNVQVELFQNDKSTSYTGGMIVQRPQIDIVVRDLSEVVLWSYSLFGKDVPEVLRKNRADLEKGYRLHAIDFDDLKPQIKNAVDST